MSKDSQYYLINYVQLQYLSNNRVPELLKFNNDYAVELDEYVDFRQNLSISVYKYADEPFVKPKSDKFQKVKPILKEIFQDYYTIAFKNLYKEDLSNGEYYIIKHDDKFIQVEYYALDEKNKRSYTIDFRDSIEDFSLRIENYAGHKGRPNARKNGKPITYEEFMQYVNCTLKFIEDADSYKIYLDAYLKDFYNIVNGNSIPEEYSFKTDKNLKNVLKTLETRKSNIEKRLIEEDSDSNADRIKLRGEIDGLIYAINTIKVNL